MFSAVAHKNLAAAEGYFVEHLAQNDYYAAGEIRPGQWLGVGAAQLGLGAGQLVTREQFYALCENQNPQTGQRLTLRQNERDNRRVFFDFTCSAPKSVSVLAVTLDDQRLVQAHEGAARVAFRELEAFAAARVRKAGGQRDRTTRNLVAAAFVHTSSRALDPQLHTHFTVFNATYDECERSWKALQAGAMYEAIRYATTVYRNDLARRVREIGYQAKPAKHGFEIEGVSDTVLKRFSKRALEVKRVVGEMEQTLGRKLSNNEVSYAVHQTRTKKLEGISTAEVREHQLAQFPAEELQALRVLMTAAQSRGAIPALEQEQASLSYAMAHVFERRSVVPEHELLATALAHRPGDLDLARLKQKLAHSPELLRTKRGLSTHQILETELSLIQTVNAGCDAVAPLHPTYQPADWLSEDQQRAVLHMLRTSDRITGIRGLAGTGKTTALREMATACQQARIEPLFCAPTAAATEVLKKEGFSAVTLQSLLLSKAVLTKDNLVVLDEAGAVSIDDMKRLFDLAKVCRVVLSGDTGQHGSVVRGDALRLLERNSRFQSGQLSQIRRQRRAEYRKAVELAAQKRTIEAFGQLDRIGLVTEVKRDELYKSAAKSYLQAFELGKSVLLVAPTWVEIEGVTEKVREALKSSGRVAAEEGEFHVFDSLSWTEAQKRDGRQYRPGLTIRFDRSKDGFHKGEQAKVVAASADSIQVQRADGSQSFLPLGRGPACFDVGEGRQLRVALRDKLLLQATVVAGHQRFVNGELVEVKAIQGDSILLTDGRLIPANYRSFTHGYAVTSHAAQGKTVDEVFIVASARSLPAVSQEQFYVSISRGRVACRVFTDDRASLLYMSSYTSGKRLLQESIGPSSEG
jgi:conjugative relaxase-like TrwC/TraI family protein